MAEHCTFWKFFIVKLRCWWKQMRWKLFYTLLLLSLTFFFYNLHLASTVTIASAVLFSPLFFFETCISTKNNWFSNSFCSSPLRMSSTWVLMVLLTLHFVFFFVTMVLMFCIILPPFQIPHFNEENVIDFQIVLCSLLKMSTWKLLMTTLMRKVSLSICIDFFNLNI